MINTETEGQVSSSFRDPSGSVFYNDGVIYRRINFYYKENYDHLMKSGLYDNLVEKGLLIRHDEVDAGVLGRTGPYKIIRPEHIPFISYPYEWCFGQLKDAALHTLSVQKIALDFGMSLKDGSAFNIQFLRGRPVFIDTLSFKKYADGVPWVAYGQFCRHFLAPLALMSYRDARVNQFSKNYVDGIPLDLASSLLPLVSYFDLCPLLHIHLHAKSQRRFSNTDAVKCKHKISRHERLGLIDNLEYAIRKLAWRPKDKNWTSYYENTDYSKEAFEDKKRLVEGFIDMIKPESVWDIGANTGAFGRLISKKGIRVVSIDSDHACVENNYLESRAGKDPNILPLVLDIANPSPSVGWGNKDRMSLAERAPADAALALALLHHLVIGNNLPFAKISDFFAALAGCLIIEFVPKDDPRVRELLAFREDIFSGYSQDLFEAAFKRNFAIEERAGIKNSGRVLYLMRRI